ATALMADGPQNLLDAMTVASAPMARGVVVVCAGTVHCARDVRKQHTYRLDAFSSGDAGPVAHVEDGQVRALRDWPVPDAGASTMLEKVIEAGAWPRVEIVMSHAGAGGALVEALVAQEVDGLVVAGTGNGTVHNDMMTALLAAVGQEVPVVRTTRCAEGQVIAHASDVLPCSALSPAKARIDMMLSLLA
ncbi:MAG: asparaginase, partial [Ramlibacter sp.]